jgi:hypothetical protein
MSVLEAKTRNALLVFVLIAGVISAVVLVSIEEPPEIACGAGDHPDKENRNGREVRGPTGMNSRNLVVATNEKGTVTGVLSYRYGTRTRLQRQPRRLDTDTETVR